MKGGRVVSTEQRRNARWWRFTINNPTTQDYEDVDKLQWKKHCTELIAQEERGEDGTLHIQGYVGFSSQKSANQMQEFLPRSNNANTESAKYKEYCCKPKSAVEGGRKWFWSKKQFEENKEKNERSQIRDIMVEKNHKYTWWQTKLLDLFKTTPDFRTIHWYWSDAGSIGKTSFARHIWRNGEQMLFVNGKGDNIKGCIAKRKQQGKPDANVIIYGIPRDTNALHVSYKGLEEVKDGIFFSPRYESDMVVTNPPHLVVFANIPPLIHKLSEDRWNIVKIDGNIENEIPLPTIAEEEYISEF